MDFVDNRIDPLTGTIRARAVLDNSDGLLLPGLFVRLRLIGETRPGAVLVPDEVIGTDQSNRVVYVVDNKNIVSLRTVTTGRLIDGPARHPVRIEWQRESRRAWRPAHSPGRSSNTSSC